MTNTAEFRASRPQELPRWQRLGPIATLLMLSPLIGEVMSGATRLSYIFAVVPEIMVWGCGTLIIREWVRRWRAGWTSILLLGMALSIAEEFIIQQTSIAPLPWLGDTPAYGRVWGVNWPYLMFMLGYESVWIVLVPIQVTDLLFRSRREQTWVRGRGLWVAGAVFAVGAFIAWFLWTQQARPAVFHVPVYHPPAVLIMIGVLAIVLLTVFAHAVRHRGQTSSTGTAPPRAWVVAVVTLLAGLPWYLLMGLVFAPMPRIPLLLPMLIAAGWAAGVFLLVKHWALMAGWDDMHRWALCFGAVLVCMSAGFLGAASWPMMDILGKAVLNLLGIAGMAWLGARIGLGA